jgi:DNA-binding SARP family transcriptional activator
MQLSLLLLGPFQATWESQLVSFATNATRALLAYLAVEADRPYPRELLAAQLWPDHPQAAAYTNLRQTVARMRKAIPDQSAVSGILAITPHTLQFIRAAARLDVAIFEDLLAECAVHAHAELATCPACIARLQQAAALYRGEFLHGLFLEHSQPFEEWLLFKREELHRQVLEVLHTLTCAHEAAGDYAQMRRYAARQLALEPWCEEAHAQMMQALAASGQRAAALAQYETCHRVLDAELGVEPSAKIAALYERIRASTLEQETRTHGKSEKAHGPDPVSRWSHQEWGEAPEVGPLYGRSAEVAQLDQWLLADRCRVVAVLGMGGVGKTTVVATVVRAVAAQFDIVIWRSLLNAPYLDDILRGTLRTLSGHRLAELPAGLDDQLALLLDYLRQQHCLLILDNLESILQAERAGAYRAGYEPYGQLIQRLVESRHNSCLLLTSRERPNGMARLEQETSRVRSLPLTGLDSAAGRAMLTARGLSGQAADVSALVERYSGNPLALSLVAQTVQELFLGDVGTFLAAEAPLFDDIRTVLDQQFARLSPLEWEILAWLAIEREPISLPALRANLVNPRAPREVVEALRALQRRGLLEQADAAARPAEHRTGAAFTLQNVIMEYVTDRLVEAACREIECEQLDLVNRHALLKAQAKEYVRQSQVRLILQPMSAQLMSKLGSAGLAEKLQRIIAALRTTTPLAPGYAAGNILNLSLHAGVDVTSGTPFLRRG